MAFSETMQESLGAGGTRVEVRTPETATARGASCPATVVLHGGTRSAFIRALVLRVMSASRYWNDKDGGPLTDEEAQASPNRRHLMPAWRRDTIVETRTEVGRSVEPGEQAEIEIEVTIPEECPTTAAASVLTLNAQAVIEHQIDPTGSASLIIR